MKGGYKEIALSKEITKRLVKGKNILAMHCANTGGPGFIDAGLYDRQPAVQIQNAVQQQVEVTATQTKYKFKCGPADVQLNFLSPLIANDLDLLSRPVSFITCIVVSNDDKAHNAELLVGISTEAAVNSTRQKVLATSGGPAFGFDLAGSVQQEILGKKGDDVRIDWGYLMFGSIAQGKNPVGNTKEMSGTQFQLNRQFSFKLNADQPVSNTVIVAYDDIYSIQYFNQNLEAWRRKKFKNTHELLQRSITEYPAIKQKCEAFDKKLYADAVAAGGEQYAKLCVLAYRQSLAAHKLVRGPNDEIFFPQKENFSNGSIWTVDVTYPSAPLSLLYNPALSVVGGYFIKMLEAKWKKQ